MGSELLAGELGQGLAECLAGTQARGSGCLQALTLKDHLHQSRLAAAPEASLQEVKVAL